MDCSKLLLFFSLNSAETFRKTEMGKLRRSLAFPQIRISVRISVYVDGIIEFYDQFPLVFCCYPNELFGELNLKHFQLKLNLNF